MAKAFKQVMLSLGLLVLSQAALVKSATFKCKDHDVTASDEDLAKLKECGQKIGVKTMDEMTPDKIPCFAKCIMESSGLLDENGKPHKENILKGIDEKIESAVKEAYKAAIEKCLDEHSHHITPNDQTCLSYSPLTTCAATAIKNICKV